MIAGLIIAVLGAFWLSGAFHRPAIAGAPSAGTRAVIGVLLILIGVCLVCIHSARAADVKIPATSVRYRNALNQAAESRFGLNAPVARLAAQIQQESNWHPRAQSPYAQGLAQFTPQTARWLPGICPDVGPPDPWNPDWAVPALVCYDAWLHERIRPRNGALAACARWAMTLSAYNGGLGWVNRDRAKAASVGIDPDRWFGAVATVNAGRSRSAWSENRGYPSRIMLTLEPAYLDAGWPGEAACP